MDCAKVRDRFSSLWEKELTPSEEKTVREHLSSCQGCQKEFEGFEKTMGWLRSVGEEKVPDEFFRELQKKMEERKDKAILTEKAGGKWLGFPLPFRLSVQAVAMVAIVFLVLYLTKMMPTETYRLKEGKETAPSLSVEKKSEQVFAQKGVENERRAPGEAAETSRQDDVEQAKTPPPGEEKLKEAYTPPTMAEAKKMEIPAPGTEVIGHQTFDSKEAARPQAPAPEAGRIEGRWVAKEKPMVASKSPREISLRVSDPEKVISKLHELVKQLGGEIVTSEGNILLVSVPASSYSEFDKELAGLSSSIKTDKVAARKQVVGGAKAAPRGKREEVGEKGEEPARLAAREEGRIAIRILLIQE